MNLLICLGLAGSKKTEKERVFKDCRGVIAVREMSQVYSGRRERTDTIKIADELFFQGFHHLSGSQGL